MSAPPRANMASAVISGKLFAAGGSDVTGAVAKLEVYDPATNTWATKASMPTARFDAAGDGGGGLLFVIGGVDSNGDTPGTVEAYTL